MLPENRRQVTTNSPAFEHLKIAVVKDDLPDFKDRQLPVLKSREEGRWNPHYLGGKK